MSQTCSTGAATVNDCSSFMCAGPPALRGCRRRPGRTGAPASNVLTSVAASRSRAPTSPLQRRQPRQHGTTEGHGVARRAVVGGAHGRGAGRRGVGVGPSTAAMTCGRDARLVAESDDDPVAVADRLDAAAQRGGHPVGPALAHDADAPRRSRRPRARARPRRPARRPPGRSPARRASRRPRAAAAGARRARRAAWASRSATPRPRRARRRRSSGDLVDASAAQVRQPAALAAAAVGARSRP